jgi:dihydropyrimidine dehydrogenase (NAD+) subunit PreT
VIDAVEYISKLRQSDDYSRLPVGRRVVVVGGGNTAIDISVQIKLLGADEVTMVYRRGPETMTATWKEQELAQKNGVLIKEWSKPVRINGSKEGVTSVDFEKTVLDKSGKLQGTGEIFSIQCDQVFKAIGQVLEPEELGDVFKSLEINGSKITVDANRKTTLDKVYAGGDCINGGALTVTAVQDGKVAAHAIHKQLTGVEIRRGHGGFTM